MCGGAIYIYIYIYIIIYVSETIVVLSLNFNCSNAFTLCQKPLGNIWNPLPPQLWVKYYYYCSTGMPLALNNPQRLICHKTNKSNQVYIYKVGINDDHRIFIEVTKLIWKKERIIMIKVLPTENNQTILHYLTRYGRWKRKLWNEKLSKKKKRRRYVKRR